MFPFSLADFVLSRIGLYICVHVLFRNGDLCVYAMWLLTVPTPSYTTGTLALHAFNFVCKDVADSPGC